MNHALKAVITLVFGAGLAVAAQAQGTNNQTGTPGGTNPNAQTAPMPNTAPNATAPNATEKKAVRPARMARHGMKRGLRHEARQGRGTHMALARFQHHRVASLERMRLNRMSG